MAHLNFFFSALYFFIAGTYGEESRWGLMTVWLIGATGFYIAGHLVTRANQLKEGQE